MTNAQTEALRRRRISARMSDFNPIAQLQPESLLQAIGNWKAGRLGELASIIDAIEERDDTLPCVLSKAIGDVTGRAWDILTVETTDPVQKDLAKRQRDVLMRTYNDLVAVDALDEDMEGGMRLLSEQMLAALSQRYSAHHLEWRYLPPRSGEQYGSYTVRATHVPAWWCEASTGRLRFIAQPHGHDGVDMPRTDWLVGVVRRPLGPAESIAWMFKRAGLQDWFVYCSRYGLPGIEGITDAAPGTPEYQVVEEAVAAAGSEFAWVRSKSAEIRLVDFSSAGNMPFPPLVERMDRVLTRFWRGADLSTMSAGTGSGEGASLQGAESDTLATDRAAWVAETLNRRITDHVLSMVFGPGTPRLAYLSIVAPRGPKGYVDLAIDRELLSWGFDISAEQAAERYGRPIPPAGARLLRPPQPPGMPAANEARPTLTSVSAALVEELRQELKVPASWLAPLQRVFDELALRAADKSLSDREWLAAAEAAVRQLPDLLGKMDIAALASTLERGMGTAALDAARSTYARLPNS